MPEPAFWIVALVAGALAFAAFTQGFGGFGLGIIIMAMLTPAVPDAERLSVVATLTGLVTMVTLMLARRGESRIDWRAVGLLLGGIVPGMPLGYFFILEAGERPIFGAALGVVLVGFALNGLLRPRVRRIPAWAGVPIGVLSGFITGGFSSGGPPLVLFLYAREPDPRQAKGTLQVVFILTVAVRLSLVQGTGPGLTAEIWGWFAGLAPVAAACCWLGHRVSRNVSARRFTQSVYALIGAGGVLNIARFLAG